MFEMDQKHIKEESIKQKDIREEVTDNVQGPCQPLRSQRHQIQLGEFQREVDYERAWRPHLLR